MTDRLDEIIARFAITPDEVERWALRLYEESLRYNYEQGAQRNSACLPCGVTHGYYGETPESESTKGFLNLVRNELRFNANDSTFHIGVWFTTEGIAGWSAGDHYHCVPTVIERLLLGRLPPRRDEVRTFTASELTKELPRRLRLE